jgi:hypothetical protein
MTIYCAPTSSGLGDGSSWDNAIGGIAAAIAAATTEEIWCKEGTYTLSAVITAKDGCDVFGGFSSALTGTDGTKAGRDLVTDVTTFDGVASYRMDSADMSFDGVRFYRLSGGVQVVNKQTNFYNCTFESNTSSGGGAGILFYSSALVAEVDNCLFIDNEAPLGGAVDVDPAFTGRVDFTSCVFGLSGQGNYGTSQAGAAYIKGDATFTDCDFGYNYTTGSDNSAHVVIDADVTFRRCKFHDGSAGSASAGPRIEGGTVLFENCVVYDNIAGTNGAAIQSQGGNTTVNNCTFSGNTGTNAIYMNNGSGSFDFRNCIFWDNTVSNFITIFSGSPTFQYCDIEGGYTGTGNINSDPLFVGSGFNPYELGAGSPCIDAGDGDAAPTNDYLGQARVDDPTVTNTGTGTPAYTDIGAYEYVPAAPPLEVIAVTGSKHAVYATPAERARGCKFAEKFVSAGDVVRNGGQIVGSPEIRNGAVFEGVTGQVIHFYRNNVNFDEMSIIFEFTPDFESSEDTVRYLYDSELADRSIFALKLNSPFNLQIGVGGTTIANISHATYSPYWRVSERNFLAISAASGANKVWLNGVLVSDSSSAWAKNNPAFLVFGARYDRTFPYSGTINKVKIFDVALTDQEIADLHNDTTYNYRNETSLYLPMGMSEHDPDNIRTLDVSGNDRHAQFGDGVTSSTFPTKTRRAGYDFDGGEYLAVSAPDFLDSQELTFAFELTPNYIPSDGGLFYICDADFSERYYVRVTSGVLQVVFSNNSIVSIAAAVYEDLWKRGENISFFVSANATESNLWIAGKHIVKNGAISFSPAQTPSFFIGAAYTFAGGHIGKLTNFRIWDRVLTPLQALDLHLNTLSKGGAV